MTDEELDEARGQEAWRRLTGGSPFPALASPSAHAALAARLGREGWQPEDPLLREAREIVAQDLEQTGCELAARKTREEGLNDGMTGHRIALAALRRGIEIGKAS